MNPTKVQLYLAKAILFEMDHIQYKWQCHEEAAETAQRCMLRNLKNAGRMDLLPYIKAYALRGLKVLPTYHEQTYAFVHTGNEQIRLSRQ